MLNYDNDIDTKQRTVESNFVGIQRVGMLFQVLDLIR